VIGAVGVARGSRARRCTEEVNALLVQHLLEHRRAVDVDALALGEARLAQELHELLLLLRRQRRGTDLRRDQGDMRQSVLRAGCGRLWA